MAFDSELQQQLINDLILESVEGLDQFDRELLVLEKGEAVAETMNIIFRVIHTIKGTAGCMGFSKIESVAHVGENLLSLVRDGKIVVTPPAISALLRLSDSLREMLGCLEASGDEGNADYTALIENLTRLQSGSPDVEDDAVATTERVEALCSGQAVEEPAGWGLFDDEPEPTSHVAEETSAPWGLYDPEFLAEPTRPNELQPAQAKSSLHASDEGPRGSVAESAIRVNVSQLDRVMNLVGELVLARNQILQHVGVARESSLLAVAQRLNLITTELQESVMKTRMQPIGNVWAKFPRIVRDVSHELGKEVRLEMQGKETELDRTIVEAIKDPLTHIVRNAIDHGIETPERRMASGKPACGLLYIRSYHEGGQVNIEIMDDGAGIDPERLKAKAVEKGLISAEQAARLSEREAYQLIFLPGFSTAEKVTNISGRGVGMDVVRTNIEKIGGSVDIHSELGQGTTLKIKIPLTLAIIPALIVTSSGERFAIPQVSLVELVRLEGAVEKSGIESVFDAPVYRLRGKLLPLVYLNRAMRLGNGETTSAEASYIVVLQADGRQFGLVVDAVNDTEEIVVKPLAKQLKSIACFAGATIMGDGKVALILDVVGLAQQAKVITESRDYAGSQVATRGTESVGDRQTLLLFSVGSRERVAIPLSMAARLEEFPREKIERAGGREVIQYRGRILPLIRVSEQLGTDDYTQPEAPLQVVVYSENGRSIGLVVGRIDDIIEEPVVIEQQGCSFGIMGSAVLQGKVTDLLDVPAVIRAAGDVMAVGVN